VLGLDPRGDELRQRVGAQLQEAQLPDKLKVWEALDLYSSFYPHPADWEELLEELGLADKRTTAYNKLSGGQKQRLSIALALAGNPEIAILDELTTGLDPHARREVWQLIERIRDRGVTVLLDVRDDGAGFAVGSLRNRDSAGFGLDGMRQRLRRVAGNLEIESAPGEGTAINASVPAIAAEGGG